MNSPQKPNNDQASPLDELISQFREASPPADVQATLREVATQAASVDTPAAEVSVTRNAPWWQRSVAVPVPVLMATAALLMLALFFSARSPQQPNLEQGEYAENERAVASPVVRFASSPPTATATGEDWSVSQSYLGTLQSYASSSRPES